MKEKILKLKNEGKTNKEISEILGCAKSTVTYHCDEGQKDKTINRTKKRRQNILVRKTENFKSRTITENIVNEKTEKTLKDVNESVRFFQIRDNNASNKVNTSLKKTFTWEDVIEKFTENTVCYLSGEKINLYDVNYNFDHIIPVSRGGDNSLSNLGILHVVVNKMKNNLTTEELIDWCIKILKYKGFEVNLKS